MPNEKHFWEVGIKPQNWKKLEINRNIIEMKKVWSTQKHISTK